MLARGYDEALWALSNPEERMTCPAGCLRAPGHSGFHTTVSLVAVREDKAEERIQTFEANPLGPFPKPNTGYWSSFNSEPDPAVGLPGERR
jgi:hypothetical protein